MRLEFQKFIVALVVSGLFGLFVNDSAEAYKKITLYVSLAPEVTLESESVVAVLDFAGYDDDIPLLGEWITNGILTVALSEQAGDEFPESHVRIVQDKKRGGAYITPATNDYVFVERSQMEGALAELSIGEGHEFEESQVVELAGLVGADYVVYGSFHTENHSSRSSKKVRIKDKKTKEYKTILIPCEKRTVTVNMTQRIMDVETGEILAILQDSREGNDEVCRNERKRSLRSFSAIAEGLANNLSGRFAQQFLAHTQRFEYELDKIKTKEFKKLGSQAADAADEYDIRRAYHLYKELYEKDPYNPKIVYNLGVMYNFAGEFDEALKMYKMAQSLKKSNRYTLAVRRCEMQLGLLFHMNELGMDFIPLNLESEALAVAAQKIKIRGSFENRNPVYAEASSSSAKLVSIPGGIELDLISSDGDWFEVRLIDGRSGFIHADSVDHPERYRASR